MNMGRIITIVQTLPSQNVQARSTIVYRECVCRFVVSSFCNSASHRSNFCHRQLCGTETLVSLNRNLISLPCQPLGHKQFLIFFYGHCSLLTPALILELGLLGYNTNGEIFAISAIIFLNNSPLYCESMEVPNQSKVAESIEPDSPKAKVIIM